MNYNRIGKLGLGLGLGWCIHRIGKMSDNTETNTKSILNRIRFLEQSVDRIELTVHPELFPHRAPRVVRPPRTVTAIEELAGMPDGTVIIGPDGLVGEKRDWPLDLAVRYVNGTQEANADIPLPARVIHIPEAQQ